MAGLVRGTEGAERGYIFWRIGRRSREVCGREADSPEASRPLFHLCDLSDSAVKVSYFAKKIISSPIPQQ